MNFLDKLDYLMEKNNLNKSTLSKACEIPYTTIDGWYKKGYEGLKLTTLRKLSNYFGTSLDFWANDNAELIIQSNAKELFIGAKDEIELINDYRTLNLITKSLVRGIVKGISVSERIANSKGETISLDLPDSTELAQRILQLEPEYKQAAIEMIEQMIAENNDS